MGTKVQIMDLELDLLTQETFEKMLRNIFQMMF